MHLNENSLVEEKIKFEKRIKANRMCLMIMPRSMLNPIRGGILEKFLGCHSVESLTNPIKPKLVP